MSWLVLGLVGVAGALAHDAFELFEVSRVRRGGLPPDWRSPAFVLASLFRVLVGGAIVAALAATGQISGPVAAFLVGVLGPMLVGRVVEFLAPDGAY